MELRSGAGVGITQLKPCTHFTCILSRCISQPFAHVAGIKMWAMNVLRPSSSVYMEVDLPVNLRVVRLKIENEVPWG